MKTFGLDIIRTVFGPVLRPRFVLSIPFWVLDFLRESGFSKIHGSIECKYQQLNIEFGHRSESQDKRVLQPSLLTPNIHRWPRWITRPLARGWNCSNFGRNLQDSSMDEDLKTINDKMYKINRTKRSRQGGAQELSSPGPKPLVSKPRGLRLTLKSYGPPPNTTPPYNF